MKEIEVTLDTDEIADFLFEELPKRGLVPTREETEELADIFFEYLIKKQIVEEEL
ncbi:YozD family protein [Heyndrickxia camelliae]|uniref:YozD family protein n=1 Tax=Heyndrickxia camelliae TaxID=1707093 RepID=A0A2N3LD66_9BACI|nr:YozD family protein [Heyndrickxia camelliae]PKR82464.1 YozD family protein [Heyndrickxia camelliae]